MSFPNQNNFNAWWNIRDWFNQTQRNFDRVGDLGEVSDDFKERAYKQFHEHDFHKLAKIQDEFVAPDVTQGTQGRENNRNVNRMEYDLVERTDGKDHDTVMKEVSEKNEFPVKDLLNRFKTQGYTICSTASAVSTTPIKMKDYKDQIKL